MQGDKMTAPANQQTRKKSSSENTLFNSIRILSDITRRDIEKSYNIKEARNTEAHYSNRYGWTLRRAID